MDRFDLFGVDEVFDLAKHIVKALASNDTFQIQLFTGEVLQQSLHSAFRRVSNLMGCCTDLKS
eukprot:4584196-Amphidinium_carterae.1